MICRDSDIFVGRRHRHYSPYQTNNLSRTRVRWLVLTVLLPLVAAGCMRSSQSYAPFTGDSSKPNFSNKRVAILPVHTEGVLTTDSIAPVRLTLNQKMDQEVSTRLAHARVTDTKTTTRRLVDNGRLDELGKVFETYNATGMFDKKHVRALSAMFGVDYLVLARLRSERIDVWVAKTSGSSLDVLIVDGRSATIVWGGIGQFKKHSMFGLGNPSPQYIASELVRIAFLRY